MDVVTEERPLSDLFTFARGDGSLTREKCHGSHGDVPVYTAAIDGPAWFFDRSTHAGPLLTYTTDGVNAGTTEVLNGEFCLGGHRAALVPMDGHPWSKRILPEYAAFVLEPRFKAIVKLGSVPSLTWTRIKDVRLEVPLDDNGNPDLDLQRDYARRCALLRDRQREIRRLACALSDVRIDPALDHTFCDPCGPLTVVSEIDGAATLDWWPTDPGTGLCEMPLSALVDYRRGHTITRKDIANNPGDVPVWTANNQGPVGHVARGFPQELFEGPALTLSRNGVGGRVTVIQGEPSADAPADAAERWLTVNEDRFVLVPKAAFSGTLSLFYLALRLEPCLREACRGRRGPNGETEFTKVSYDTLDRISIPMPLRLDGTLDLDFQKQYVNRLMAIQETQREIVDLLASVSDESVDVPLA